MTILVFLSIFKENKSWLFMRIVSALADDSHEMTKVIFSENIDKK